MWLALGGSGASGMLVALQSRINGGLSGELGSGYVAAVVSFGSGLVILAVVLLCSPKARGGLRRLTSEIRAGRYPLWGLLGGACGAFFVLSQGLVAGILGVALFTVGVVAGQVLGGLVMDRIGLGPGGRIDPTAARLTGTALVIVAVITSVISDLGHGSQVWLVTLPLIAGFGVSWQSAVNGLVRSAAQSAIAATFVNFVVGTAVLLVAALVSIGIAGAPMRWPSEPWLYVGGACGVVFIALNTVLVRIAGVLLLSMSGVAGQLVASVLLELGLPLGAGVNAGLLIAVALALVAVVVAALPARRRADAR